VVTAASLTDHELCVLLNQDEQVGYVFHEPEELTPRHAVTIHRSQGVEHAAWSSLVTSAWPILQRTPVHYP
jgi:exodeoxyribonuclease V alpha subunit